MGQAREPTQHGQRKTRSGRYEEKKFRALACTRAGKQHARPSPELFSRGSKQISSQARRGEEFQCGTGRNWAFLLRQMLLSCLTYLRKEEIPFVMIQQVSSWYSVQAVLLALAWARDSWSHHKEVWGPTQGLCDA